MKIQTSISVKVFNELCDSTFSILYNQKKIYYTKVDKNNIKEIFFDYELDFTYYGNHFFHFKWNSNNDCANKYFKLGKIVVHGQKLPAHNVKVNPYQNDYINSLKNTQDGNKIYKQKTMYPGYTHGWYGDYEIEFEFGDKIYFSKMARDSVLSFIGIKKPRIYVDKAHQRKYNII